MVSQQVIKGFRMLNTIDIFNNLTSILNKAGIRYNIDIPGTSIAGNFSLNSHPVSTMFRLSVSNGAVVNHTYLLGFSHPITPQLLQFINLINSRLLFGNFECVNATGIALRFRYALPGTMIKDEYVGEVLALLQLPSLMFSRYMNGFFAVVNQGVLPQDAA